MRMPCDCDSPGRHSSCNQVEVAEKVLGMVDCIVVDIDSEGAVEA
jgi:hypothetical protein